MATAISLRRSLTATASLLRFCRLLIPPSGRHFSALRPATNRHTISGPDRRLGFHPSPRSGPTSRGFAKGRRSKVPADDGGGTGEDGSDGSVDIGPAVKSAAVSQMEAAKDALVRELSKLRTGRASAGMLDHIVVEISGAKVPLNRAAMVSVLDAKTLSVTPYDQNSLKAMHTAIIASPLGLNPTDDGHRLIAVIPPLTKENTQALCKVVNKHAEDVKQSIRRARQKALDTIKKSGSSISKDSVKRLEKEIDETTKRFVKSADEICKSKEKEIMGS